MLEQPPAQAAEHAPDHREPSPERQRELDAAYRKNIEKKRNPKPPYDRVTFHSAGEIEWAIQQREWHSDGESYINLRGADLRNVNLSGLDLRYADFSEARLDGANFTSADLRDARVSSSLVRSWGRNFLKRGVLVAYRNIILSGIASGVFVASYLGFFFLALAFNWRPSFARPFDIAIGVGLLLVGIMVVTLPAVVALSRAIARSSSVGSGPNFTGSDLRGTDLSFAYLRKATFSHAQLGETNFTGAYLKSAVFSDTPLAGANFSGAVLTDANIDSVDQLVSAIISSRTTLIGIDWGEPRKQYAEPRQGRWIRWRLFTEPVLLFYILFLVSGMITATVFFVTNAFPDGIPAIPIADGLLSAIWAWGGLAVLLTYAHLISFYITYSRSARLRTVYAKHSGHLPQKEDTIDPWERARQPVAIATYLRDQARIFRAIALELRHKGLYEQASEYRVQELACERKADHFDSQNGRWFISSLLNLVAGYGDRPLRILITYLLTIGAFVLLYVGFGHVDLGQAVVLSFTSFHGRGFFSANFKPDNPVMGIAAGEAVIGLLIEIVLIATLTRRFVPGS